MRNITTRMVVALTMAWTALGSVALAEEPLDEAQLETALGGKLALWLDASDDATLQEYRYNGNAVPTTAFDGGKVVRKWSDRRAAQSACYAINARAEVTGSSNAGFVRVMPYTITNAVNGRSVLSFGVRGRFVTGFQNRIADDGTAMSESAEEGRRLLFNEPVACATAVMVFGSQDGGGYALLGGLAKASGENLFLASNETCSISTSAAPMWRSAATPANLPILASTNLSARVDGFAVDPTVTGFSGGYQIISLSVPAGTDAMTVRSLGMKDAYGNAGGQRYGEVLVFSNRLESAEIESVERYLARKWGLESTYGVRKGPSFSICCVGDSITEGSSSFVCHRVALEEKLAAEGWSVTWRGSHVTTSSGSAQLHEGWGGKTAEQVATIYETNAAKDRADVLLIHAGHNHYVDEQPVAGIIAAHRRIIAAARAQNPNVLIFDAQVITSGKLPKYSYIPELNQAIVQLAQELSTERSPVVSVDMAEGWDWTVDTVSDMVHPSATGAQKMAAKWFAALAASSIRQPVQSRLLEAEAMSEKGGWVLDTQFVDCMGSPYLLAHGLGVPVADAVGSVWFSAPAWVRLWVRTRDWTPDWDGVKPGRFRVMVNGVAGASALGTAPAQWGWVDAGAFVVDRGENEIRLQDLTGFEGRCDAFFFASDLDAEPPPDDGAELAQWRREQRGEDVAPENTRAFDLVVVGGGMAGTCAAVAAAERGMSVAIVQDRPMLGGNASGEIRVHVEGEQRHRIVGAVGNTKANGNAYAHVDDTNRMAYVSGFTNLAVYTGWRAYGVVTNAADRADAVCRLAAVDARHTATGERLRLMAPLFVDATGDGWIGYWAGARYRMGREAASEYAETNCAPAVADTCTMGNSLLWSTTVESTAQSFPEVPWAMSVAGTAAATSGGWTWEAGLGADENTIYDAEMLRDRLFRAIYGRFSNAKQSASNANRRLSWVPYIAGKRESRRILGDYVVRESDVMDAVPFEDAIGTATWSIDLHFYNGDSGFIAATKQIEVGRWYMPYRSLCCRDVSNLFLAGRCASYTHVAMGSSRVMRTGGQQGVAVGYAASLCKQYGCDPREIYCDAEKTAELQTLIGGEWPSVSPSFADDIIVDNADVTGVEINGDWVTSSYNSCRHGADYLHSNGLTDGRWVRFTPTLPTATTYRVWLIWNGSTGRGSAVPVEVVHADGVSTNYVDMVPNPGDWVELGQWNFAAGNSGSVRILTEGQEKLIVIADAVKFSRHLGDEPDADSDGNGLPDAWERRHFLQTSGTDPNGDPDGDGFSNAGEWLAGTDPNDSQDRFVIRGCERIRREDNVKVSLRWPNAPGRTYRVLRAEHPNGPFTVYRDNVPAATDGEENVLELPYDDSPSAFYKVQVLSL